MDAVMKFTLIDVVVFAETMSAATNIERDTSQQATLAGVVIGLQVSTSILWFFTIPLN